MDTRIIGALFVLTIAIITVGGQSRREIRVGVEARRNGARVSGEWRTGGRRWDVGVGGNIDTRGNWGAGVRASWRFKKRSIAMSDKRFEILINLDACHFDVYDIDGDEFITLDEMKIVFYEDTVADELFNALDITTGDGRISKAEFKYMAPRTIANCVAAEI